MPLRKRLFYHAIEWVLGGVTRRIITVSPEEHRLVVRKGIGRSRVILIPNGVAPIAFPPRAVVRRGLGLTEESVAIGFIGRLVDQKAPDVLVKAFSMVASGAPLARLVIVGSGPLEVPLRNLADRLGIGDRILWLGERDGTAVLPGLDLFAIASRKEGLPYVLLEAMAAGLPIVATATSGVELLVDHGRNGFIVPPNCPEAFAAALADLTSDPQCRARFGLASLEQVGAVHDGSDGRSYDRDLPALPRRGRSIGGHAPELSTVIDGVRRPMIPPIRVDRRSCPSGDLASPGRPRRIRSATHQPQDFKE